jgi:hypothetical protein
MVPALNTVTQPEGFMDYTALSLAEVSAGLADIARETRQRSEVSTRGS